MPVVGWVQPGARAGIGVEAAFQLEAGLQAAAQVLQCP